MNICIYIIRNKKNNKIYVGYTTNYKRRKKDHFDPKYWTYQPNKYLYRSMNKHGTSNFHMFIIEKNIPTKKDGLKLEIYYIKYFKMLGYILYNETSGGEGAGHPLNNDKEKYCSDCKLVKLHKEFDKNHRQALGLTTYCKECTRKQRFIKTRGINEYKVKGRELNNDTEKYCPACKTVKPNNNFHKDSSKTNGLDGICKNCAIIKNSKNNIPLENHKHRGNYLNNEFEKYCPNCSTLKSRSLFSKNKSMSDGLSGYCKSCCLKIKQKSRKLAKEKRKSLVIF